MLELLIETGITTTGAAELAEPLDLDPPHGPGGGRPRHHRRRRRPDRGRVEGRAAVGGKIIVSPITDAA